jgi:hypothetical protein
MMSGWRRWLTLNATDRLLLIEAAIVLGIARASTRLLPFHRTAALFGLQLRRSETAAAARPSPVGAAPGLPVEAKRPAWAVSAVAARVPVAGTCLTQALAGSAILGRRGIATTVHLGVAIDPRDAERLTAHAWLRCGDAIVTGAAGSDRFTPLAAFAVRPARQAPTPRLERRLAPERCNATGRHGLALQRELIRVLGGLAADGIGPVVVLKGIPLALRLFGSIAEREMVDLDLLVHRHDVTTALVSLRAMGYAPVIGASLDLDGEKELTLRRRTSSGAMFVDLHWSPIHPSFGHLDEELMWRHTEPFTHQGIECLVFDPAMTIVHLGSHYVAEMSPKVLRDLAAAWNLWADRVGPDELLGLARETEQLVMLCISFARAAEAGLLDVGCPEIRSYRARLVLRLLHGRLGSSEHGRSLIISKMAMRPDRALRLFLRQLFPSRALMRVLYGDGTATEVACRYVVRPLESAAKLARALAG